MQLWRRNLIVCWFGMFISSIGMSQIAPVLPMYIQHFGITNTALITRLSGIAFGVTFILLAIFSPIWGSAADKYGRKPMLLRASIGMSVVIGAMAFAPNVYVLIGLRLLQGAVAGYGTACTTLIATQTDKEHAGYALGTLSTASIAGSLLGPTVGGFVDEIFGLQSAFLITGVLLFISFIITLIWVKEDFVREDAHVLKSSEVWNSIPKKSLTLTMFATYFVLMIALYSIEPIMTVYIKNLSSNGSHVALLSGIAFSASGLANIIAAPKLGKLSDKIGAHKVILFSLIFAGIVFIPQAFVTNAWQLMGLRFLLGLSSGGLGPSINIIIRKITPANLTGRIYGYNMSAAYIGIFIGSIMGGQIAGAFGIRYVFFITSSLLLVNALWVYFKVYKAVEKTA